jgi:PAS domain S-box-containing protein
MHLACGRPVPDGERSAIIETLLQGLDVIVWQTDATLTTVQVVSPQAEALGYPLEQWCGEPDFLSHHLHADEREDTLAVCRAVAADRKSRSVAHRMIGPDGQSRWFRTEIRATAGDGPTRLVGMMQDITERIAAQSVFSQQEARLRAMLDQLPVIVYTTDRQLRFTSGAGAGLGKMGLRADQIVGVSLQDYLEIGTPGDSAAIIAAHRRVLAGTTESFESGRFGRDYQFAVEPFRDDAGTVIGTIGVVLDITPRKQAEREREHLLATTQAMATASHLQAARLAAILNTIQDPVIVCDVDGRLTHLNHAALAQTGLSAPAGQSLSELLASHQLRGADGSPMSESDMPLRQALRGTIVTDAAAVAFNARKQEDRHLRLSSAPIRDETGAILGAVAVSRDVTDSLAFERLKVQFVHAAAHELKTPVTIMKGAAQVLLRSMPATTTVPRRALDSLVRGADRIDRLAADLLTLSELDLNQLELICRPFNLTDVLTRLVAGRNAATTRHRLQLQAPARLVVNGDAEQLELVFLRLLDNAIRYSPAGGDIRITAAARPDGEVTVAVVDPGIGIPAAQHGHVFERFFRAHAGTPQDFGGLGLGLYLANTVVRRHGGRMWFDSREGGGSTFHVALPGGHSEP